MPNRLNPIIQFKERRREQHADLRTKEYHVHKTIVHPSKGLNFSVPEWEIDDSECSLCKNLIFENGIARTRGGLKRFLDTKHDFVTTDTSPVIMFKELVDYDGTKYLLAANMYRVSQYTAGAWASISGAVTFTTTYDDFYSIESIYDDDAAYMKYFITNGVNVPYKWTGTGNIAAATVPTGLTTSKIVKNFQHHLLYLANTISGEYYPQRIDWSAQGTPEDFTSSGSGNNNLAKSTDEIVAAEVLKNILVVFKERSIAIVSYVGGVNPFIFEELKVEGVGCAATRTVQNLGNNLIFLGMDNIYLFDGFTVFPVANKIKSEMFRMILPQYVGRSFGIVMENLNSYILCTPSRRYYAGSYHGWEVWVWNYIEDSWSSWHLKSDDYSAISFAKYYKQSTLTIGELKGTIGIQNWRYREHLTEAYSPTLIVGTYGGNIYEYSESNTLDDETKIEAYYQTKDFFLTEVGNYARVCSIVLYAIGRTLDLYYSIDGGKNWTFAERFELDNAIFNPIFSKKIDVTSERIMFKFFNDRTSEPFTLRGFDIVFINKDELVIPKHVDIVKAGLKYNIGDVNGDLIYVEERRVK